MDGGGPGVSGPPAAPVMRMTVPASFQPLLSRRQMFGAAIAIGTWSAVPGWSDAVAASGPVVSFHRDTPYLDATGRAEPFRPRIATDWADELDDEALIRLGFLL